MTATETQLDSLAAYVLTAAQATANALPAREGWAVEPAGTDGLLPSAAPRAVGGRLGAVTLLLVTDPELAAELATGGTDDDLVDACRPGLLAAAIALAPLHGDAVLDELALVDAERELAARDGRVVVAARLVADGGHQATLVLVAPVDEPVVGAATVPATTQHEIAAPARLTAVPSGLEMLHDVEMDVTAELGRTRMQVRQILELVPGSVIELDRAAGSPVDVLVNGTLIARGEVVVIDEEFGIRITDVVGYEEDRSR
jgi:flagellar motor switch protein FliN/FliY